MAADASQHQLLPTLTVIERGWLNCNQIVLRAPGAHVLIDSGYGRHADVTAALVATALAGEPLHRLINTHCHSDHMGGNRLLRARYACRVTIPEGEVRHVRPWTEQSCWSHEMDQYAEAFEFDDTLVAGDEFVAGGLRWQALAAPGHDMDALMFWCASERLLITGDALWERGCGFVWPLQEGRSDAVMEGAFAALETIEQLAPKCVIPGHGAPFTRVVEAVTLVRGRLAGFAADPPRGARHVVKVMFVFALLDRGSMPQHALSDYLARVPVYGRMRDLYLHVSFDAMAATLLADLLRAGAVCIVDGQIVPTMRT